MALIAKQYNQSKRGEDWTLKERERDKERERERERDMLEEKMAEKQNPEFFKF